jgi:hypothetical protein
MPDGWRMISRMQTGRMVGTDPKWRMADMDPELEASIPLFAPRPVADPVTARKNLGFDAGTLHEPATRPGRSIP